MFLRLFKDQEFTIVKASKRSTVFKYSKEYREKLYKDKLRKRKAKIEKTEKRYLEILEKHKKR